MKKCLFLSFLCVSLFAGTSASAASSEPAAPSSTQTNISVKILNAPVPGEVPGGTSNGTSTKPQSGLVAQALPKTNDSASSVLSFFGVFLTLSSLGLLIFKKKEVDN
ncbi:LPXTG cell wall anchor domain-containing protein [Enterococcus faecium]|uniref:LPXTG cell wall anchor domain-containing protein n=1 Tax=Enterococcus faecium TaxID=1352 RepID=UPI0002A414E3|nr:LPXTG cell wall anchor domain-containing protein [Enterococcus faecium]ELA94246.1 LPXTG-domain-containing protein cell wall anchor domain [Enterococcus faecium EnGen0018]